MTSESKIKLYFAPRTRSVRILWLLEELGIPYELEKSAFIPTGSKFFVQKTPHQKYPTIEDGDLVMSESGAIIEYLLEKYGEGRLAPAPATPERGRYLQWLHFSESTAFAPIGVVVWLTVYRDDAGDHPGLVKDAQGRVASVLTVIEKELDQHTFLGGDVFTAADIMMGFTLVAAQTVGLLDERFPNLQAYIARLAARPAFQTAASA